MEEQRVKASIWVSAQVRMCGLMALPVVVRRRGDADAGSILIRIDRMDGHSVLLSQSRDSDGRPAWLQTSGETPIPDGDVETYIERRVRTDPDIWIIEIEDKDGRYEPDAPVIL